LSCATLGISLRSPAIINIMLNAKEIIDIYISFFEKRGHKRIPNSPLVPLNDPTTLFTSSGMQPLIQYLLGQEHPAGIRLVDVQNSFRAVDIEEVGDNRHETFFRMLGNWSLGDYFKAEEISWLWELLTVELGIPKDKLYITVFKGEGRIEKDNESFEIWKKLVPEEKIFFAGVNKNWWSRSGIPDNMPIGEPGGPDTEVYYKFDDLKHDKACKDNPVECECGKFLEIANAVFMQYLKTDEGFQPLPKQNVDFGGGVERLLAAIENKSDIFTTSLFAPIIKTIGDESGKSYEEYRKQMQIITDHLTASIFIANENIKPGNKDQGYVLRRLLRRAFDNFYLLEGDNIISIVEKIVEQYNDTDSVLKGKFEEIKNTILEEETNYKLTLSRAKTFIDKKYSDKLIDNVKKISSEDAFQLYSTHGLSPTQIKSLGYIFDEQEFAQKMEEHQKLSRAGAQTKFKGGLADHSKLTIMGHTATHLLHQALRDVLGNLVFQTGSNITNERIRFDFNFDRMLTPQESKQVEDIVNQKIKENLPVRFEILPLEKAKTLGAIGLFDDKYTKDVKVYFVGDYSAEFCGGPHVNFTGELKRFKIIKVENIGKGQKRIYSKVNEQVSK
jgi:alanyl-tRNA synthetase